MTLFNDIMPYFDEFIHVYGWNMSILWSPLKIWTPKNFTTANFRHPVSKSWLRHWRRKSYMWPLYVYYINCYSCKNAKQGRWFYNYWKMTLILLPKWYQLEHLGVSTYRLVQNIAHRCQHLLIVPKNAPRSQHLQQVQSNAQKSQHLLIVPKNAPRCQHLPVVPNHAPWCQHLQLIQIMSICQHLALVPNDGQRCQHLSPIPSYISRFQHLPVVPRNAPRWQHQKIIFP